jgi:hypothetical protein
VWWQRPAFELESERACKSGSTTPLCIVRDGHTAGGADEIAGTGWNGGGLLEVANAERGRRGRERFTHKHAAAVRDRKSWSCYRLGAAYT